MLSTQGHHESANILGLDVPSTTSGLVQIDLTAHTVALRATIDVVVTSSTHAAVDGGVLAVTTTRPVWKYASANPSVKIRTDTVVSLAANRSVFVGVHAL